MPSYKLLYFDVRGRGELTRYVFYAAGRDFEDFRIKREDWPTYKPNMKYGQGPVLEVDGTQLAQSSSMARYLAREFGLAGKNSWEQALVDETIELGNDMRQEVIKAFFEQDEAKKAELNKKLVDEVYPKFLKFFDGNLEKNGGKFFVGDSLTLADLAVYYAFDTAMMKNPKLMDGFPKLKAHRDRVGAIPKLAEYVKNRKQTDI